MRAELISRPTSYADIGRLALGPVVYTAGIAAWWVSDRLVVIGPFDRAQIGWAVAVPLLALGPAVTGLAAAPPHLARAARRLAFAIAGLTGIAIGSLIATSVAQVGCQRVTSPLDVLWQSIVVGVGAGLACFGGFAVSAAQADDHPLSAVVTGTVTWLLVAGADVFLVFAVLFPPLSCAAPSGA